MAAVFLLISLYLFHLVWPPWGAKHAGNWTALIVKDLKDKQALSVMVELSLSPLDVSWPFPRAHELLTLPV